MPTKIQGGLGIDKVQDGTITENDFAFSFENYITPAFTYIISSDTHVITSQIPGDTTTPLITEGVEIVRGTIVPKRSTSKILVSVEFGSVGVSTSPNAAMFLGDIYLCGERMASTTYTRTSLTTIIDSTGQPMEFSVRVGRDSTAGTIYVNRLAGSNLYGVGDVKTVFTIREIFI